MLLNNSPHFCTLQLNFAQYLNILQAKHMYDIFCFLLFFVVYESTYVHQVLFVQLPPININHGFPFLQLQV